MPNDAPQTIPVAEVAAAYGRFIMNFTALESALEALLLNLAQLADRAYYEKLHRHRFARKLGMLQDAVCGLPAGPQKASLDQSCKRIAEIANWRNERVHARIDPPDWQRGDVSHYSFFTGTRLRWDVVEIESQITELIMIGQLGFWTAHSEIQADRRWKKEITEVLEAAEAATKHLE